MIRNLIFPLPFSLFFLLNVSLEFTIIEFLFKHDAKKKKIKTLHKHFTDALQQIIYYVNAYSRYAVEPWCLIGPNIKVIKNVQMRILIRTLYTYYFGTNNVIN